MRPTIALALALALASSILVNPADLRERDAAARLARISARAEGVPGGALGVLRVMAFAGVIAGAILLATGAPQAATTEGAT